MDQQSYDIDDKKEEIKAKIDYKMVTFSLAGKDYGIDIMCIKEISKVNKFTYIPNTYPYVRGVHNLRGEIISIIDLRKMFRLQFYESGKDNKKDGMENVLILKLKDTVIGIIVDTIDKVIGISSESIQPPPSLFGDINIKYISGVCEYEDKLYVILDVNKIFVEEKKEDLSQSDHAELKTKIEHGYIDTDESPEFKFITETLEAFKKYYVTPVNEEWVRTRVAEWISLCKKEGRNVQLAGVEDADSFLYPFYSPLTGLLWDEDYKNQVSGFLPEDRKGTIGIWNPGSGKGPESYSIACCVKMKYPGIHQKVWANDISLIDISTAPTLMLAEQDIPDYFHKEKFVEKSEKGFRFTKEITDAIFFEYHDILIDNAIPPVDIIIARDVLSFFSYQNQVKLLSEFGRVLKNDGVLFIGMNERINEKGWTRIGNTAISAYTKENV
ncbi:MAG: chemotaxis protein CheW [Spirochaetales bacterium]|nr:chemotaxis protein CheW [Spirochaetales bacterium]